MAEHLCTCQALPVGRFPPPGREYYIPLLQETDSHIKAAEDHNAYDSYEHILDNPL
jgi:hypothetical protein